MESLLKLHGKNFGSFWACETCAEKMGSPEFRNKNEIEQHIQLFHSDTKSHSKTFDSKINNIVDMISDYDKEFKILTNNDLDDCTDRVMYFIKDEENLDLLDDNGIASLLDEIQNFYEKRNDSESLLDFNHKMTVYFDFATNKQKVFIGENTTDDKFYLKDENDYAKELFTTSDRFYKNSNNSLKSENTVNTRTDEVNCTDKTDDSFNLERVLNSLDQSKSSEHFRDATLACDDKRIQAFKSLADTKENCEASDFLANSEVFVKNIYEIKIEQTDSNTENNTEDLKTNRFYNDFFNKLLTTDLLENRITSNPDSPSDTIISCDYCLYKTTENKYLEWHIETFHEENILTCEKCKFSSQLKSVVKVHIENEHHKSDEIMNSDDKIILDTYSIIQENDNKKESNVIIKESSLVANVEYDDILIDSNIEDLQTIEDLSIKNYDLYTYKTEDIGISIKEELLNVDKDNQIIGQNKKNINQIKVSKLRYLTDYLLKCDKRDFKSKTKDKNKIHVKATHQGFPYTCNQCEYKSKHLAKYIESEDEQEGMFQTIILNVKHLISLTQDLDMKFKNKKLRKIKNDWKRRKKK